MAQGGTDIDDGGGFRNKNRGARARRPRVRGGRPISVTDQGRRSGGVEEIVVRSDGVEGDSVKKKGVGQFRNAGGTPNIFLLKTRPEGGFAKLPNGEIESKSWNDERGGGVSQEGKGERKKKGGGRRGRTGRKKRRKGRKKIELGEEVLTSRVNHRAVGVDVNNGIFRR